MPKAEICPTSPAVRIALEIRWMVRRDMPDVLRIERESFEFPWSEKDFIGCLRRRSCIGHVAEHDDRLAGFMIYEFFRTRLHILNFAVAREFRRRGIAGRMLAKLVGKLSSDRGRRNRITLEVRETNLPAQLFLRAAGFRAVSVLRGFYDETAEDAYVMQFEKKPR